MTGACPVNHADVQARARLSQGSSNAAIYRMVARALEGRHPGGGVLVDVGCGTGNLWPFVDAFFARYVGVDTVRYDGFPAEAEFHLLDLDRDSLPISDASAEVVAAVETIEHLENPRAFLRELVRIARPGGYVIVTTPNQLSLLSKLTLVVKNQFNAFQDGSYPAHLTALLEVDLRRMAAECALTDVAIAYSLQGRIVLTPWHYPRFWSRLFPRALSDNVLLIGRKPRG
jgi:2-polyprenyl-3-methyl-5-hydroxy-6-metoxy-1,4-benzoquinol methylase